MFERELEIASATHGIGHRRVRIDGEGVWIHGRLAIGREAIGRVRVELAERPEVLIHTVGSAESEPVCALTLPDRATCDAVVIALGRSPNRVVLGTSLASPFEFFLWGAGLYSIGFIGVALTFALLVWAPWPITAAFLVLACAIGFTTFGRHLEIGDDGLVIRTRLGRTFLDYAAVESIETWPTALTLRFRSGALRHLGGIARDEVDELADRIRQRLKQFRELTTRALPPAENESAFRHASVPEDELWRVAEDAAAPGSQRRRALRELADVADRERLRVAVESTLDPEVAMDLQNELSAGADELPSR